jgi:hypothetical protein
LINPAEERHCCESCCRQSNCDEPFTAPSHFPLLVNEPATLVTADGSIGSDLGWFV